MKHFSAVLPLLAILLFCSFSKYQSGIAACYISFNQADGLKMAAPERLPEGAAKTRTLQTPNGDVDVSRIDGYRILYNNKKQVPFVNVKVEKSDDAQYAKDTTAILANLQYVNSKSIDMESKNLIELSFNGYKLHGVSRSNIDAGSTLGIFVMFPGNNMVVYFYFNNLKPEVRNFESLDDYKGQRNAFLGGYTAHLQNCGNK